MPYAWTPTEQRLGLQAIDEISTTQNHALGTRVRARHATYGEGEFIYLLGVANTVTGLIVRYNATTYQTTIVTAAANTAAPYAVAMAANVASSYGWYQIAGNAVVKKTAVAMAPSIPVYISGTAGRVKVIASAGLQVLGARTANLATISAGVSTITLTIDRPHGQGQII